MVDVENTIKMCKKNVIPVSREDKFFSLMTLIKKILWIGFFCDRCRALKIRDIWFDIW